VALTQTPVFRSTTNLQSIAVQVIDNKGQLVPGLAATDFTLLEDGRPQKIAFFGAQHQPATLAILLDSSRSMDFDRKFDRARELIAPLIAGQHPNDQIFLMPFSDRVETPKALTAEERRDPELIEIPRSGIDRGTALYDALSSALCRMRNAENLKQAVVLLTDGADQHSRLRLDQLIELARRSTPQIFMIGFFGRTESQTFKQGGKTVTLFVTGEGEVTPALFTGRPPAFGTAQARLPKPRLPVAVTVGGMTATTQVIGIPAGLVGQTQINFTVPPDAPLDVQPVVVTVGTAASPPVNMAVTP